MLMLIFISACSVKKEEAGPVSLKDDSKLWIPFEGTESVAFVTDTSEMTFTGKGKESLYVNTRYNSDQSGFFSLQKDYYADLEQQTLIFKSPNTPYYFKYYLQKYMGATGSWDILQVTIADGEYYQNEIKMVVYESDSYDKGEVFTFSSSINLNGNVFKKVYYWKQENRPFEIYYNQEQGIIGFKLSSNELWTIKQPE
jgi:hypothetical protein